MNQVSSSEAPKPIGPYSQAIEAGGIIYCSGAIGVSPVTSALISADLEGQTAQALKNIDAILVAAGSGLKHILKTTVLLRDMNDFGTFNLVYQKIMTEAKGESPMPARTTYAVTGLPMGALVEIDCIALRALKPVKLPKLDQSASLAESENPV